MLLLLAGPAAISGMGSGFHFLSFSAAVAWELRADKTEVKWAFSGFYTEKWQFAMVLIEVQGEECESQVSGSAMPSLQGS